MAWAPLARRRTGSRGGRPWHRTVPGPWGGPFSMADAALRDAVSWLLERQGRAGWWTPEMGTAVTMTAEHILLLRFLGADDAAIAAGARQHILGAQRTDGTWALYY